MTRAELAERVRKNFRASKYCSPWHLAKLNEFDDDLVINGFLNAACGDCGKKLVEGLNVDQMIAESHSLWDFAKAHAGDHVFTFVKFDWPNEINVEGTDGGAAK